MNKLKNILIMVGVIAIVLFIYNSGKTPDYKTPAPTPTVAMNVFRDGFMDGCLESDAKQEAACSCIYNSMLKQLGEERLIEVAQKYANDKVTPDEMLVAVKECIYLYK